MALTLLKSLPDGTLTKGDTLTIALKGDPGASITVNTAGPKKSSATDTADPATGKVTLTFDTSDWPIGIYLCEATQTLSGVISRLDRSRFEIVASLADIEEGADVRSRAEIAVEMLEKSLAGNDTAEVQQYKINNRELRRYPVAERLDLLAFWKRQRNRERRMAAGSHGLGGQIGARI